ncbi:lytic polysaccharide monooxygenase, partial [Lophiostoma macrostomum CBS 122681]
VLLVNKTSNPDWTYVRDVGIGVNAKDDPQWPDILPTKNFACGVDAWKPNRNQTGTADVVAGTEIGMRTAYVFHIGPAQAYLGKAPDSIDNLSSWDPTDADWFKIGTAGAYNDTAWFLNGLHNKDWNFTIPATTPPGKYLLRHEQIWPQPLPDPRSSRIYGTREPNSMSIVPRSTSLARAEQFQDQQSSFLVATILRTRASAYQEISPFSNRRTMRCTGRLGF